MTQGDGVKCVCAAYASDQVDFRIHVKNIFAIPIDINYKILCLFLFLVVNDLAFSLLIGSYGIVGILSLGGYVATVRDLHFKKRMTANPISYLIWTLTGGITFLYSLFVLPDVIFRFVSGLSFFSCLLILMLSLRFKTHNEIT